MYCVLCGYVSAKGFSGSRVGIKLTFIFAPKGGSSSREPKSKIRRNVINWALTHNHGDNLYTVGLGSWVRGTGRSLGMDKEGKGTRVSDDNVGT